MSLNVKSGDTVVVLTGKDNGKVAKVISTAPKANRVIVEGVNIVTKHEKAKKQNEKSKIVKVEAAIDASNVMVICPSCGKATRVAYGEVAGKKARICKKCAQSLDKAIAKEAKKAAKKEAKVAVKEEVVAEVAPKATKKTAAPKATKEKNTVKTTAAAKTAPRVAARKTAPSSGK